MANPRTARQVIDQAIKENRPGEWLCYTFAIVFVLVGIVVIFWGAIAENGWVSAAGSIAGVLFWPAMREARQIRRENMAIRLLETVLDRTETATSAAEALRDAFTTIFVQPKN